MRESSLLGRLLVALGAFLLLSPVTLADLASAQRLYEEGRADEALAEVDSLLASNPADPELRFLKGIIYAEQGRNDDAIEIFAALTQDYPELPEPYNNLAVLFAENGEFEKAREALLSAIQTHPSYSTAHENLGDLYAKMASLAYDRALEEDDANESARIKLSAVNGLFSVPGSAHAAQAAAASEPAAEEPPAPATPEEPVALATEPAIEPAPEPAAEPEPEPQPEPAEPATTVATATPPAGVAPAPAPAAGESDAVAAAVETWRSAWTAQNVEGYLAAYASDYAPGGMSHDAWRSQRRDRLTSPSFVRVDIEDMQVAFTGPATATATFVQSYSADSYADRVRKTLTLAKTGSAWRIVREDSQPL
jgi:outer membrane biosynthesis protein TonB